MAPSVLIICFIICKGLDTLVSWIRCLTTTYALPSIGVIMQSWQAVASIPVIAVEKK